MSLKRVLITGAAGLVGQNLTLKLKEDSNIEIIGIDKHKANIKVFRDLHPDVKIIEQDLSKEGAWFDVLSNIDILVINHAQIGATSQKPFIDNNVIATENVLKAAQQANIPYIVHISSSVVNSMASDFYTETKKKQERLVLESGIPSIVLRPTLMFGLFDRKHLGWLRKFMFKAPVFPIPGHGKYVRQPLFVSDFCDILISAINDEKDGQIYNISGHQEINYIDLIREVKLAAKARIPIIKIPYSLFWLLLKTYSFFDKNPPFTTKQLAALVTPDKFEVIDWPTIFNVQSTPLDKALNQTFQNPIYSNISLEF
ncbi:MAG: NAD-dependent epimerase/dehydratase family protein [Hyphomicrobiales bacterium]